MLYNMQPAVYRIQEAPRTVEDTPRTFYLEYMFDKFTVPKKIYGDILANVTRIWNDYALGGKSTGVLLTGDSGSGKSLLGQILSNLAIDNKLPCIMATEIFFNKDLIAYLYTLKNCVLFMDEFAKNTDRWDRNNMLTMLADPNNTKKLFIMTENREHDIGEYILNRPGRIRYHIRYNKISMAVFTDYCKCNGVTGTFYKDLFDRYNSSSLFSFDQLDAVVTEHKRYPQDSLDDIIEVLNTKAIAKVKYFSVIEVVDRSTGKEVEFVSKPNRITHEGFTFVKNSMVINILMEVDGKMVQCSKYFICYDDLTLNTKEDIYIYEDDHYTIKIKCDTLENLQKYDTK